MKTKPGERKKNSKQTQIEHDLQKTKAKCWSIELAISFHNDKMNESIKLIKSENLHPKPKMEW